MCCIWPLPPQHCCPARGLRSKLRAGGRPVSGDPPWSADAPHHTPPVGVAVCTSCTRAHTGSVGICTVNRLVSYIGDRYRRPHEPLTQVAADA